MERCYAVIFVSQLSQQSEGYRELAAEMVARVQQQPGYLGADSVRGDDGLGITVSYWESREAIAAWKNELHHMHAQQLGRERYYDAFTVHVARVERSRHFSAS